VILFSVPRLGEEGIEGYDFFKVDEEGNLIEPNTSTGMRLSTYRDENIQAVMETMYYPPQERFNSRKESRHKNSELLILLG
jgi:hypothetical protein